MRAVMAMLLCAAAQAQVALVHAGSDVAGMDAARVRDMLLGRVSTWSDGSPVTIVLVEGTAADASLALIAGRDHARLLRGWKRLVYSGGGTMPMVVGSVREAQDAVARRPGAIAVVEEAPEDVRLKRVRLDGG